jgi:enamine deaminase RidA (YjgF/YER057c/UK114 family)
MIERHFKAGRNRSTTVIHDGTVFTVANATARTDSVYEQMKSALALLEENLARAGTDKSRLLQVTVYIADIARKPEMNRAWDEWLDLDNPPQRACIGVALEGEDLIEIVAIAATHTG